MIGIASVAFFLALAVCSAQDPASGTGIPPKSAAPASPSTPAVRTTSATLPATQGLRPSYAACIGRADGVIPATQACIDAETNYQQARLERALAEAERTRPKHAATLRYQQAAWQADTDANCAWDASTEGQQQRIEANMCSLRAIAARAHTLSR